MLVPVRQAKQGGDFQPGRSGNQTPSFTYEVRHLSHSASQPIEAIERKSNLLSSWCRFCKEDKKTLPMYSQNTQDLGRDLLGKSLIHNRGQYMKMCLRLLHLSTTFIAMTAKDGLNCVDQNKEDNPFSF